MAKQKGRIPESLLVLPIVYLMDRAGGKITTSQLQKPLREMLRPKGADLAMLSGRRDDKFSQKVRNIKAHGTLERLGMATFTDGYFVISDAGRQYIVDNKDSLEGLLDFDTDTLIDGLDKIKGSKKKIFVLNESANSDLVSEGGKRASVSSSYVRSRKLREYAVTHFRNNGGLCCACCGFDFGCFYGTMGEGIIEIHHLKPVYQYEQDDMEKSMAEAIKNLTPVCSNCHRVIHRHSMKPLSIEELKSAVMQRGF